MSYRDVRMGWQNDPAPDDYVAGMLRPSRYYTAPETEVLRDIKHRLDNGVIDLRTALAERDRRLRRDRR